MTEQRRPVAIHSRLNRSSGVEFERAVLASPPFRLSKEKVEAMGGLYRPFLPYRSPTIDEAARAAIQRAKPIIDEIAQAKAQGDG